MKRIGILIVSFIFVMSMFPPAAPVRAAEPKAITLNYENVFPKGHMRLKLAEEFIDRVEKNSQGKIKIDRHYGEPSTPEEAMNALGRGMIDVLIALPTYYSGKIALGDWTMMPSNFREWDWQSWHDLSAGRLGEIMDEAYQKKTHAKFIISYSTGPYNFQISKKAKKIRKFEDFKGMKIRAMGGASSITVKQLGASPVMTIGGEYYQAMQKGVIDAGLMTSYSLKQYRIWEVADQVVGPSLMGNGGAFIWMNLETWNKLGSDLQNFIMKTARDKELVAKWEKIFQVEQDEPIIQEAKKMGIEFYDLPKADAEKMYKAMDPVWEWWIEQCDKQGLGPQAKETRKLLLEKFYAK